MWKHFRICLQTDDVTSFQISSLRSILQLCIGFSPMIYVNWVKKVLNAIAVCLKEKLKFFDLKFRIKFFNKIWSDLFELHIFNFAWFTKCKKIEIHGPKFQSSGNTWEVTVYIISEDCLLLWNRFALYTTSFINTEKLFLWLFSVAVFNRKLCISIVARSIQNQ